MLKIFPASRFHTAKILVADDTSLNLKVICAKLAASGYTNVHTAVDGDDALRATHRIKPDLVLLDLLMPKLDGFGYLEKIRKDPKVEPIPVIVQTGVEEREAKLRALSCGADDFLNKPLDLEEMALRVHIHLERYFILQHVDNVRGHLKDELKNANNTIDRLRTEVSDSDHAMLAKHYDVLKTIAAPLGQH